MKAKYQYQIIKEVKNASSKEVIETASTKREIERRFNSWIRCMKKSSNYSLFLRNIGFAEGCFCGSWGIEEFELYICRAAI